MTIYMCDCDVGELDFRTWIRLTSNDCYAGKTCLWVCTNVHLVMYMKLKHKIYSEINCFCIFERNNIFTVMKNVGHLSMF